MTIEIKTTHTCFGVLEAVEELDGAGVTEVANHIGVSKASAHKHLKTLEGLGYLVRHGDTFHLGLKFLNLGLRARDRVAYYEVGKAEIDRLIKASGERAALLTEENGVAIYLYSRTGRDGIEQKRERYAVPLHSTPGGKAILAHLPPAKRDEVLNESVPADEITELEAELAEIRERGLSIERGQGTTVIRSRGTDVDDESSKEHRGVGAPVFDDDGYPIAAIEVTGPTGRLREKRLEGELLEMVETVVNSMMESINSTST